MCIKYVNNSQVFFFDFSDCPSECHFHAAFSTLAAPNAPDCVTATTLDVSDDGSTHKNTNIFIVKRDLSLEHVVS